MSKFVTPNKILKFDCNKNYSCDLTKTKYGDPKLKLVTPYCSPDT